MNASRSWFPDSSRSIFLQSIVMLLRQLGNGEAKVENQYKRVVPWEGNRAALKAMAEVFELRPYFEWRGLGIHFAVGAADPRSVRGMGCRAPLQRAGRFASPTRKRRSAAKCSKACCKPAQCKLFGNECTPEHPIGALMVSSEGSCAAYYNYEHRKTAAMGVPA